MDISKWIGTHPLYQFGGTHYKNLWSNIKRWSGVHTFVYLWALDVYWEVMTLWFVVWLNHESIQRIVIWILS